MAQSTEEVQLITWHFVRNHYERHRNNQNVPVAIKYLISQFSDRIIASNILKILSIAQDLEFVQLLTTKLPSIKALKLLYRASQNDYSANRFHKLCDNKGPTITIIKSNWGNIFGGYASMPWISTPGWRMDENTFLFLIKSDNASIQAKCPMILLPSINEDTNMTICSDPGTGPLFGTGKDICIIDKCSEAISDDPCSLEYNYCRSELFHFDGALCGGNRKHPLNNVFLFQVIDYEVYSVE